VVSLSGRHRSPSLPQGDHPKGSREAAPPSGLQEGSDWSKDNMSKDNMSKDSMSKDSMKKDTMKKEDMKK
jgi:hypothetical protein